MAVSAPEGGRRPSRPRKASLITAGLLALLGTVLAAAPGLRAQDIIPPAKSLSVFPILMYDTDIGVGYGGRSKFVDWLNGRESLDLILFNSSKGERWYVFTFSRPDFELRQGRRYGLSFDLKIEYDRYAKYPFFGVGREASKENRHDLLYEKQEVQLTFGRGLTPHWVVEAAYTFRHAGASRDFDFALPCDPGLECRRRFSHFGSLTFRRDTTDSQINPTRGYRVLVQMDLAAEILGNAHPFVRGTADGHFYTRPFGTRGVLAVRALIQQLWSSNPLLWDLSVLGGGSSMSALRGYPMNRYMDKAKWLSAMEYRFPLWKRLGGVAFVEGGTISQGLSSLSLSRLLADAGGGLRYNLDDFIVRFDVGFSREGTGIYFNFNQLF